MKPSPAALSRLGAATALTVVLGLSMAFIPLGPMLVMPFLVLPAAHLLARWGLPYAALLVVVAGGLMVLLADMGWHRYLLMLAALSTALGLAIRRRWSFGRP